MKKLVGFLVVVAVIVGGGYAALGLRGTSKQFYDAPALLMNSKGTVEVAHGGGVYSAASTGMVKTGDGIRTGADGVVVIRFPNGSASALGPSSEVRITSAQMNRSGELTNVLLTLTSGSLATQVSHNKSTPITYQIAAGDGTFTAHGTNFVLAFNSDGTVSLAMINGSVNYSTKGGHSTTVPAGSTATFSNGAVTKTQPRISLQTPDFTTLVSLWSSNQSTTDCTPANIGTGQPVTDSSGVTREVLTSSGLSSQLNSKASAVGASISSFAVTAGAGSASLSGTGSWKGFAGSGSGIMLPDGSGGLAIQANSLVGPAGLNLLGAAPSYISGITLTGISANRMYSCSGSVVVASGSDPPPPHPTVGSGSTATGPTGIAANTPFTFLATFVEPDGTPVPAGLTVTFSQQSGPGTA